MKSETEKEDITKNMSYVGAVFLRVKRQRQIYIIRLSCADKHGCGKGKFACPAETAVNQIFLSGWDP